ncbi:MAG: fumarylacetoacetate hydrolase family protein [Actinomycetota bacterium]
MRLVTYDRRGHRRLGAFVGAKVVDLPGLAGHPAFPSTMEALVSSKRGTVLYAARAALDRTSEIPDWVVPRPKLLVPILPPSMQEEEYRSLVDPEELVPPPPSSNGDTTFEVELAAIVGNAGRKLTIAEAKKAIFGYTLMIHWSNGDDFSAALGPCILTPDEFEARHAEVKVKVNGRLWSKGTLAEQKVNLPKMIMQASKMAELMPGDVYSSGTLGRIGQRIKGPKPGSEIEVYEKEIGTLKARLGKRARRKIAS